MVHDTADLGRGRFASALQGYLGWLTLMAVFASTLAFGGNHPPAWLALALVVAIAVGVQYAVDGVAPPRADRQRAILLPAATYFAVLFWGWLQTLPGWAPEAWHHPAWAAVAAPGVIAIDPTEAQHHLVRLACYAGVFWIAARAATDRVRCRHMVIAIALFSTGLAIFGLGAFITGSNPIIDPTGLDGGPLTASFVNRNSYATYAAFGLLANIAAWIMVMEQASGADQTRSTRRLIRDLLNSFVARGWWFACGALTCGLAIVIGQSRGGTIAAVLGVVVFFVAYQRARGAVGRVALLGVILGAVFIAATSFGGLAARFFATTQESGRFIIFPVIVEASFDRFWLGHGLGGLHHGLRAYIPPAVANVEWDLAHNSYLSNLFELGAVGAAAFYAALAAVVWRIAQATRGRRRDHVFASLAVACVAVGAAHSLVDFSLEMPGTAALFAVLLGIGWRQSFSSHKRSRRQSH